MCLNMTMCFRVMTLKRNGVWFVVNCVESMGRLEVLVEQEHYCKNSHVFFYICSEHIIYAYTNNV